MNGGIKHKLAELLAEWVERGGVLICDGRSSLYDEHGLPQKQMHNLSLLPEE